MASGLVLIDKPAGITSFDVVAKLRKILNTRKIGHAGTLDPMATGLMLLGVNQGTKLLQFLIGMDKQYVATIRLGASTVSDDAQGEVVATADASAITAPEVDAEIKKLTGEILQLPSSVSAKKIAGRRAYDLVREGHAVVLTPKKVVVTKFQRSSPLRFSEGFCDFDVLVECSSGTYIRALARDIGISLHVGGHLTALRRTKIGSYSVAQASKLSEGISLTNLGDGARQIWPSFEMTLEEERFILQGRRIGAGGEEQVAGFSGERLVAILEKDDLFYRSIVVFPAQSELKVD